MSTEPKPMNEFLAFCIVASLAVSSTLLTFMA